MNPPPELRERAPFGPVSLCRSCSHLRVVRSAKGSEFLLCRRAQEDPQYRKYPPQPVVSCRGHEVA